MQGTTLAKIGITVAIALGGVGFLVKSSLGHAEHYQKVDELLASTPESWTGHDMKVHGFVYPGSIIEKVAGQETERTFVLTNKAKTIRVFSKGPKPDTFKDQSEVVASGRVVSTKDPDVMALANRLGVTLDATFPYVVVASELMAKCPSKYDGATSNKTIKTTFE